MQNCVHEKLKSALPDLSDGEWKDVIDAGFVEDAEETGMILVDEMVEHVKTRRRRYAREVTVRVGDTAPKMLDRDAYSPHPSRNRALSIIVAAMADKDQSVDRFRTDILDNQLLSHHEVQDWVAEYSSKQAPGVRAGLLAYGVPADDWQRLVPTTPGSELDQLRELSNYLHRKYAWDEAQASLFVLTGMIPVISQLTITPNWRPQIPALSRVTLTVDPTLPPSVVAEQYAEVRRGLFEGRYRPQSNKHLELAVFATLRPAEESWRQTFKRWNEQYPDWRYNYETNFRRDCKRAVARLLSPLNTGRIVRAMMSDNEDE